MLSYNIHSYGRMIRDSVRSNAYYEALRASVKPSSVVLDIGTGVGILAVFACQFGARKVYAVDPNGAIQIAREIAASNGFSDRIEFIEELSTKIVLPEPVDIVVTEMHGVLPMFEQNIASIIDARRRLLADSGRIIPQEERLWAAPVEDARTYEEVTVPWGNRPYAIDMRPAVQVASNSWFKARIEPKALVAEPKCWAVLDYRTVESPDVAGEVSWTAKRPAKGHGVAVWFDTSLAEGIGFSNAPGCPETIFSQAFFPWPEPVAISPGDTISMALRADSLGDYYLWRWDTIIRPERTLDQVRYNFKQSTFFDLPLTAGGLQRAADNFLPRLNHDGEVRRFVLSLMDGQTQLGKIASETAARFPERFTHFDEAKAAVLDLVGKYSD